MTSSKRKTSGGRVTPKGTRPPETKGTASRSKPSRPEGETTDETPVEHQNLADERPRGGGANRAAVPRSAGRTGLRGGR